MSERSAEVVTFLFTDVEGSTRLWEADPRAMSVALARHDALLHRAIATAGGVVFKTVGDAFCAVFPTPHAAVAAAVAGQRALHANAAATPLSLKVRMAIHTGPADPRGGDYFGPPLNRVARLLDTAHGEQIVISQATRELVPDGSAPDLTIRGLGAHTLKDLQGAERVYQIVATGLRTEFPPLRTPRRLLRNVPQPATDLIGREREAALAGAFLGLRLPGGGDPNAEGPSLERVPPTRLLTLTGPGGAGKTRLSLHLIAELAGEFADGAAFVSLATLTDPALAPVAIMTALDLGEPTGDSPRAFLLEQLRDRHLLLVLDNLEQVMGAAVLVADLMKGCPRLSMVVTSRERLSVRGEQELPIPPLALPASLALTGGASDAAAASVSALAFDAIRQSAAVRLFVARAQSVKPEFTLTTDNAGDIVEICRRLDGLPLAIELAAARARFYSPLALRERLDGFGRRLDLLSRGQRDLPARQQTMRDTVAWSYDLLDPAEQRLFTRLAVFVGGATIETCLAVAAELPGDDPALDALTLLE
ncbi:MAG: adenylate/guanylate cyclase domain-containing protein, partial [Chloroflexota bacterium]|nr:adenylate/guanylate cyclase domain-containing protein [Chloroflexota bacterium]